MSSDKLPAPFGDIINGDELPFKHLARQLARLHSDFAPSYPLQETAPWKALVEALVSHRRITAKYLSEARAFREFRECISVALGESREADGGEVTHSHNTCELIAVAQECAEDSHTLQCIREDRAKGY